MAAEIEYFVQEEDTDINGRGVDQWLNWSPHDTFADALSTMTKMKPTQGRLRVVRTITETLAMRADTLAVRAADQQQYVG